MRSRRLLAFTFILLLLIFFSRQALAQSTKSRKIETFIARHLDPSHRRPFDKAIKLGPSFVQREEVTTGSRQQIGANGFATTSNGTPNSVFLSAPTYDSGGRYAIAVAIADVNGDGNPDLLVANECASSGCYGTSGPVGVLLGNGDGTFQPVMGDLSGGLGADAISVADVNADGKVDLVLAGCGDANCTSGRVSVLLGNGDGTFNAAKSYGSGGYYAASVAISDVNRDGKPDLVVANGCQDQSCASGGVSVLLGNGDGAFSAAKSYGSGGYYAASVAISDVNADGKPDLLIANQCATSQCPGTNGGALSVLLGNGDGTFRAAIEYASGGGTAAAVAVGDVNGDGMSDLVVANSCADEICTNGGSVGVLLGNGNGTFQAPVTYGYEGYNAFSVAIADINMDGKPDVLVAKCPSYRDCANGGLGILLGHGDGTFRSALTYNSGGSVPNFLTVSDVNGDGKLDVLLANACTNIGSCSNGSVSVLLGNGDSTFLASVAYDPGGRYAFSAAVSDVNGDGKLDLIVSNSCLAENWNIYYPGENCTSGSVGVLLGNGDGTFQSAVANPSGGLYAYSVTIADVNGDGKPDVVVANGCQDENCANGSVSVLLGNGDGSFQSAVSYGSGGYDYSALSVAIADVNGDGKPDVLVTNQCANNECSSETTGNFSVLLGNGDGSFRPAVSYPLGSNGATSVTIADVNSDGKHDAVVGNGDKINVLLGNGDGTFQPVVSYSSGGFDAVAVDVVDINRDGKADLLFALGCETQSCNHGMVGVLLGNGDGTFQPAVLTATPYNYGALAIADFNGDGNVDVASGTGSSIWIQNGGNGGALLMGNGDGTLQRPLNLGVWGQAIAFGDFNGDGRPDLAVGAVSSLAVLLNIATGYHHATNSIVTSSLNPAKTGQPVTFTATVTPAFNAGALTGDITFYDGADALSTVPINNGQSMFTTSTLTRATHLISAKYSGDNNFLGSTSAILTEIVNPATTVTSLISSADPIAPNQLVTYKATIASQYGGTMTGTVSFKDGNATIIVPVKGGNAVLRKRYPTTGIIFVTATYSGDSNNAGSISSTLTEYVKNLPVASQTLVRTSASPSVVNQLVTFRASIGSAFGSIPDRETVTFYDGDAVMGTTTTVTGTATFSTSRLSARTHTIKASYAGDCTFKVSSGVVQQIVNPYPSTMSLSTNPNPSNYGQPVLLTAIVTSSGLQVPTGKVTFSNGTNVLGTSTLNSTGTATLSTTKLMLGSNSVTATYKGDAVTGATTSSPLTLTVNPAQITMTLTSTPNPSRSGNSVKFTATLNSNGGLPNGQLITFIYNGSILGTGTIWGGKASYSTPTLPVGSNQITASYAGNVDYSATSASVSQIVN